MNRATGTGACVSAGIRNWAEGAYSCVSGGGDPIDDGFLDTSANHAIGDYSTVSGGYNRTASGSYDWVAGLLFQDQ